MTALIVRTLDRREEESRSYSIVSHRIADLLCPLCNEFLGDNTVLANVNVNATRWRGLRLNTLRGLIRGSTSVFVLNLHKRVKSRTLLGLLFSF